MVTVFVGKGFTSLVGLFLLIGGTLEGILDGEHGDDAQGFSQASEFRSSQENCGQLRIEWEIGHVVAELGQFTFVVQSAQVVEQFQGSHQGLRSRRIEKVKVDEVIDAETFKLKHDGSQVGTQNFRMSLGFE